MLETSEIHAFLKSMPLLSGQSATSRSNLAASCQIQNISKGYLFSAGGGGGYFQYSLFWHNRRFVGRPRGDVEIFIKERRLGDFFGEMGILLNGTAAVTEMAVQDTAVILIRRELFLNLVDREPSVSSFLMRTFARRVKASGEQQATNTLLPADARLEQEKGSRGIISYTQDYLAHRSGLAHQTVARILVEWAKKVGSARTVAGLKPRTAPESGRQSG